MSFNRYKNFFGLKIGDRVECVVGSRFEGIVSALFHKYDCAIACVNIDEYYCDSLGLYINDINIWTGHLKKIELQNVRGYVNDE